MTPGTGQFEFNPNTRVSFCSVCPCRASRAAHVHAGEVQEEPASAAGGKPAVPTHQEAVRYSDRLQPQLRLRGVSYKTANICFLML